LPIRGCLARRHRCSPRVHVLADFGTTVESELEVFAFIAQANDDLHAFSLLAMVVSLFETGYLKAGAGLIQASGQEVASLSSRLPSSSSCTDRRFNVKADESPA
jgi:hypothetical protein